jgi:hypothetical protein|tara:strand:- start:684 stop:935 length:252 start_codon:yes stop_codon:yes gene_type:complete
MRGGRVDRIIDRSNKLYDKSLEAQRRGKRRKASRLRKRSDKLSDKARDVACKINARGRKVCKRSKRSGGGSIWNQPKRKNRGY